MSATTASDEYFNIASLLTEAARKAPNQKAVIALHRPDALGRTSLSFCELEADSNHLAAALQKNGFRPGRRVILMVKPGLDFVIITFALFKAGLVPVMVDPGMGLRRMLRCLSEGQPIGIIGLSIAHLLSLTAPHYFKNIKLRVTIGRRFGWGGPTLAELMTQNVTFNSSSLPVPTKASDTAAILFTSGATGPAKGVVYTHAMFRAQIKAIQDGLDIKPGGVDMATFPLFALFSPALGLTSVIPNMNPTKPAKVDPRRILEPIAQFGVTSMFASPSLLSRVSRFAHEHNLSLPTLRRVISAGAPVSPRTVAAFSSLLSSEARLLTPYGATEGVPLSSIDATEIIQETRAMTEQGLGMCVGRPLPETSIEIIKISESPIKKFSEDLFLPVGEIGEIIAKSPVVSARYFERPSETNLSIIEDTVNGGFWRRMGDVGWKDSKGRLWFCGRKNHRVVTEQGTLFSIPCEAIFNNHPQVRRSALVGVGPVGKQRPVIIVQLQSGFRGPKWQTLAAELMALAKANPRTISISTFLKVRCMPVDVRHNAKINREKLAVWAAAQLARH